MKKKIVVFSSNEVLNDPRVYRTANSITDLDADVSVFCRFTNNINQKSPERFEIYRIKIRPYLKYINALNEAVSSFLKRSGEKAYGNKSISEVESTDKSVSKRKGIRFFLRLKEIRILLGIMRFNLLLFLKALGTRGDLYYANDLDALPAAFLLSKLYRGKLLYDTHELYTEQFLDYSGQYKRFLTWLEKILIKRVDKVITVNDSIAEILSGRYQIEHPAVVLSCPIYVDMGYKEKQENHGAKIIYQGIYNAERGLEELVLSAKYIEDGILYFRGYGNVEATLKRLANENDLEEKVIFLEPVKMQDLVISLEGMDVGVGAFNNSALNSYYCLPNKIFEYMMAGLALAVSDLPELRRIVKQCENGLLFNPNDPKDIADKLNFLISNPNELERMKANSLKWAKVYNWENESKKLKEIVNNL